MEKTIRTITLIVIGVISIILSIKCFSFEEMDYSLQSIYGGDAFTGIQNASAQTSKNVRELGKITQFGFGSVLLVAGLGFLGIGLTTPIARRKATDEAASAQPATPKTEAPTTAVAGTMTTTQTANDESVEEKG